MYKSNDEKFYSGNSKNSKIHKYIRYTLSHLVMRRIIVPTYGNFTAD